MLQLVLILVLQMVLVLVHRAASDTHPCLGASAAQPGQHRDSHRGVGLVRPVSCLDSDAAGDRTGAPCRPSAISVGKKHYFKLLQYGSASLTSPAVQALAKANGGVGGGERF